MFDSNIQMPDPFYQSDAYKQIIKQKAKAKRKEQKRLEAIQRKRAGYQHGHADFYPDRINTVRVQKPYANTVLIAVKMKGQPFRFGHPLHMIHPQTRICVEETGMKYTLETAAIKEYIEEQRFWDVFYAPYPIGKHKTATCLCYRCHIDDLVEYNDIRNEEQNG